MPELEQKRTATSIINARRIIDGPSDKLRAMGIMRYPWTAEFLQVMMNNHWHWNESRIARDLPAFDKLTDGEMLMFKRALAHLANLDAIQLGNLADNIVQYITDPEIKQLIYRQVWEEQVHVLSYSSMVEFFFKDPLEIYDMYRVNPVLKAKNDFITEQAERIRTEGYTPENFVYALVGNIALEGIYFYNGFLAFHTLDRMGKMVNCDKRIKLIQRDEIVHLNIFANIFNSLKAERPRLFTKKVMNNCKEILVHAADLEGNWGCHMIEGGVLGQTEKIQRGHVEWLADDRAVMIGLPKIYGTKNPIPWVEKYYEINKRDENFFETEVSSYSQDLLEWD